MSLFVFVRSRNRHNRTFVTLRITIYNALLFNIERCILELEYVIFLNREDPCFRRGLCKGGHILISVKDPLIYILFKLSIAQSCWRVMSGCRLIEISGSSGKVISFVIDSKLSIFMF